MKKIFISISLAIFSMVSLSSMAMADDIPPADAVPISKVIANIYSKGYDSVSKIAYSDDIYKAKVINRSGQQEYLYIDPTTGDVPAMRTQPKQISMSDAIKILPQNECKTITKIERRKEAFEIDCLDENNQEISIFIDAISGKISQISDD